jgi:hypothetical protein
MEEKWIEISGYEGKYMVSTFGNILSIEKKVKSSRGNGICHVKEKIVKSFANRNGYFSVLLYSNCFGKRYSLHRLVAQAFIPNPENKPQVNHKDGNKSNNKVDNLEWVTQSENNLHSYNVLNRNRAKKKGADSHISKPVSVYSIDDKLIGEYVSIKDAAIKLGHSNEYISGLLRGKIKINKIYVKHRIINK